MPRTIESDVMYRTSRLISQLRAFCSFQLSHDLLKVITMRWNLNLMGGKQCVLMYAESIVRVNSVI